LKAFQSERYKRLSEEGVRRSIAEIVHSNKYGRSKHMSSRQIVEYIYDLRGKTRAKYVKAPGAEGDIQRWVGIVMVLSLKINYARWHE
jgi:hypothetical protein